MMQEFYNELLSGNGPVFLKLDHLAEETIQEIETILHSNERPSRGRFHEGRGTNYRKQMIEMHISEIGFCSGHSASGIHVNARGETSVKGLYAAGDCASVPHNYMLGAFVYGKLCGENAAAYCAEVGQTAHDDEAEAAEAARILAPLQRSGGLTPYQIEYKTRRLVNDYLQPPKITSKYLIGLRRFAEIREDLQAMSAADPHELMRAMEAHSILDCAEMAAHASLFRTESRWGLYHHFVDHPERDDANWFCHSLLSRGADGQMALRKKAIEPYIVPVDDEERTAYQRLRVAPSAEAA
jgi:succinate dehydrogenase/fumarate reductase flavoprotein subunit